MINYKDFSGPAEQLRRGFFHKYHTKNTTHKYRRRRVPFSGGTGENRRKAAAFYDTVRVMNFPS